jgi:hypothetical protein
LAPFYGVGTSPFWPAGRKFSYCFDGGVEVKLAHLKGSKERSAMSTKIKPIVIVISVVLAAALLPLAGIFVFPHLPGHYLLLQYISATASRAWPFVIIILFIFFCLLFRPQIAEKIRATKSIGHKDWSLSFGEQPPAPQPPRSPVGISDISTANARIEELLFALHFERTARVMFRSQLELLWEIETRGVINNDFAYEWYRQRFRGNPSITPYGAYIEYLKASLLITPDPLDMHLTPIGTKFLEFIRKYQYPIHVLLPF